MGIGLLVPSSAMCSYCCRGFFNAWNDLNCCRHVLHQSKHVSIGFLLPLSGYLNDKESEEGQYFKPENLNELQKAVYQYTSDPAGANSTYGKSTLGIPH